MRLPGACIQQLIFLTILRAFNAELSLPLEKCIDEICLQELSTLIFVESG